MKRVILYHQPGRGDCRAADEFLRQKSIPYEGKDIQAKNRHFGPHHTE
jgi:arsenate reductase-like glutaredoxin family protein